MVSSVVFLHSQVPAEHPSAAVLGTERQGAGVAVAPRRILTAHYLVLGARAIEVTGLDGRPRGVRRVALDHETGLALVFLEEEAPELRPVPLGGDVGVVPGLPVFMLTCTSERERKGACGHVSVVGPFEAFWEYMLDRAIMTTAINPGLAGAPLFDGDGRLLGVVSLGLATVGRYSLAIPVELYVAQREVLEQPEGGRSRRAWVGFYPQAFDGGLVVTGVVSGGPADRAGLAQGDMILSVDGRSVASLRELYGELWKKQVGEALTFQVLRESRIRVIEVTSDDRDEFYK